MCSGSLTDTAPLAEGDGTGLPVRYLGNHQQLSYMITPSQTVPVGFTGAEVFNFAGADGERTVSGVDTDVFSLLNDLADSIERGDTNRATMLGDQVNACYTHVVGLRGQAGVLAQRYDHAQQTADEAELRIREVLSADEDLDYSAAMVELTTQQTVYQAVLAVTGRLLDMPGLFEISW